MLKEGIHCSVCSTIRHASLLVDAAAYFDAFVAAVKQARYQVCILGWDFNRHLLLKRDSPRPLSLGLFLEQCVEQNPELTVHILQWDFSVLYARERDLKPILMHEWPNHDRIQLYYDNQHPVGAAVHEKLVVIDKTLAFCGSTDLTIHRWDTPEHSPSNPLRETPNGEPYTPYHEAQMMLEGEVVEELHKIFHERWSHIVGELPPVAPSESRWPSEVKPDLFNMACAVSRTRPALKNHEKLQHGEAALKAQIEQAKNWIYIENQYLTDPGIEKVLRDALHRAQGPEVIIILANTSSGPLEKASMLTPQSDLIRRLRKSDPYHRLRVLTPTVGARTKPTLVFVHSKLLFSDRASFHIGSSNLNSRSMGFDSECDLTFLAESQEQEQALERLLVRLLAEHCGRSEAEVQRHLHERQSIVAVVDELSNPEGPKSLRPYKIQTFPSLIAALIRTIADPRLPFGTYLRRIWDQLELSLSHATHRVGLRHLPILLPAITILLVFLVISGLWRWSPWQEFLDPRRLEELLSNLENSQWGLPAVLGVYLIGGLVFFPVTVLVFACAYLFDPWRGFAYSLAGCLASSAMSYLLGAWLGKRHIERFDSNSFQAVRGRLQRGSIFEIAVLRNIPIVPFSLLNLIAGTLGVNLGIFLIGTLLGMAPGVFFISVLGGELGGLLKGAR